MRKIEFEGYHTEVEEFECRGCAFYYDKGCVRPMSFPPGCSDDGYIWVKDGNCQKVTVDIKFDIEKFRADLIEHIDQMDFTPYFKVDQ